MAGRLAQICHFVVAFLPDITMPPLFNKTLKHFCLPKCPDSCQGKEELTSVGSQQETMSPFSLRLTQSDPKGLRGKQVCWWHSHREDTCHLSALSGEVSRQCAQVCSPCSSSDSPALPIVLSSQPCPGCVKGLAFSLPPSLPFPSLSPSFPSPLPFLSFLPFLPSFLPHSFMCVCVCGERWGEWGIIFRSDLEFPFHVVNG